MERTYSKLESFLFFISFIDFFKLCPQKDGLSGATSLYIQSPRCSGKTGRCNNADLPLILTFRYIDFFPSKIEKHRLFPSKFVKIQIFLWNAEGLSLFIIFFPQIQIFSVIYTDFVLDHSGRCEYVWNSDEWSLRKSSRRELFLLWLFYHVLINCPNLCEILIIYLTTSPIKYRCREEERVREGRGGGEVQAVF